MEQLGMNNCLEMKQHRKNVWFYLTRHWLALANQWLDSSCDSTLPRHDSTRKNFWWLWLLPLHSYWPICQKCISWCVLSF